METVRSCFFFGLQYIKSNRAQCDSNAAMGIFPSSIEYTDCMVNISLSGIGLVDDSAVSTYLLLLITLDNSCRLVAGGVKPSI